MENMFKKMNNVIIVLLLITCMCSPKAVTTNRKTHVGATCVKCDMGFLYLSHKDYFSRDEMIGFFCTLDDTCSNNIEFSEVSNEILFNIIKVEPEASLKILSEDSGLSIDHILNELKDPINDGIPVNEIHAAISSVKGYDKMKVHVLMSLEEAKEKCRETR